LIVSFRISLALLAMLAFAVAVQAADKPASTGDVFPYKVHETRLDNGLDVVTIPYDSPGIVAYYLVVRTGSRDEVEPGHSGFAHFFEHIMFRGTERYPKDKYNEIMKRMGANSNASTWDDRTVYHIIGPARELETMMDVESDRFKNLKYAEEDFRTEALAVLGEYNKSVSSPFLPISEKVRDLAFQKHTYKHSTIGFLADIKAMPEYYQYSLSFFNRFYRPENTTLLVVGDVKPDQVVTLAKKYYGDWKKGYQAPKVEPEPSQTERREAHLDWPNPIRPHLMMGYHTPAFSTQKVDSAALDLVGQLLFAETAPLYQELVVDKQWVDFVEGGADPHRDAYLFEIVARAKSEDLVPKVRETIAQHIQKLQNEPVDPQRLDRIKSHLRYEFALGLATPEAVAEGAALAIGLTGNVDAINQRFAQYQKVTPADIQRVARETFRPQNETVVTLSSKAGAAQGGAR
jgi:zinc protease